MSHLSAFHRRFPDSVLWRLTSVGVEIDGASVPRTPGLPVTATRVWQQFAPAINVASQRFAVPSALILATILTESGGNPNAIRLEPGYVSDELTPHRVSPGLMQTLISTARIALGSPLIDRQWLFVPANSIMAGTAFIDRQRLSTDLDPPLVAAAYNSGGIFHQGGAANRWKLRQFPIGTGAHVDSFVARFNDGVFVFESHPLKPELPDDGHFQHDWRWCNRCEGLFFGARGTSVCPVGGAHDPSWSGNYQLVHNTAGARGQPGWRWCSKCEGLFFGVRGTSVCPRGGGHDPSLSGEYKLVHNSPAAPGQQGWRWCSKCEGLFFGVRGTSMCPAGGIHDPASSGAYTLLQD